MNTELQSGQWYRLELPYNKIFIAEYRADGVDPEQGVFHFPDGSEKEAGDIVPFLSSIIEIDKPDLSRDFNIADFLE